MCVLGPQWQEGYLYVSISEEAGEQETQITFPHPTGKKDLEEEKDHEGGRGNYIDIPQEEKP
eukprot:178775-Amphidinium_carterae.1